MMNFKLIKNKKNGSAMIVVMLIFFAVFILSFGSGYVVFLNAYKSMDTSENIKAYNASLAGVDRAHFEAQKNNFDFAGNCSSDIFSEDLGNDSSYIISCVDNAGDLSFYSTGTYKKSKVSVEIDCININNECLGSCKTGSFCGGGKLLKTATSSLSISPSGCDASGANCSNSFATADTVNFQWDTTVPDTFQCGTTTIDYSGQVYNSVKIGNQCWMKENLNVGTMLPVFSAQTNNAVSEKWCYNSYYSGSSYCTTHGGWYIYGEVMQYNYQDGAQGLCPSGWHIPTLAEWNVLATSVPVMCPAYPYAFSIKTSAFGDSSPNCSGMTVLPAGFVSTNQTYFGDTSELWISNGQIYVLNAGQPTASIYNASDMGLLAASARCIKDSSGSGSITYKGASSSDNGKTNNTTLVPQTNTYLEAAKYCDDLVANGFSDWYLPATNELLALRNSLAFPYFNLQSVSGDDYWVSTEQGSTTPTMAGYVKMSTGASSNINKGSEFKVRCVRKEEVLSCSDIVDCGVDCEYEGKVYKTIYLDEKCWFKTNLNVGVAITASENQTDNSVVEKYCYNDDEANCDIFGGLYKLDEAMKYTSDEPNQGICPSGWHIPMGSEWWAFWFFYIPNNNYACSAGYGAGKSLAYNNYWTDNGTFCNVGNDQSSNNTTDFSVLPAGLFDDVGDYYAGLGDIGGFWSTSFDLDNGEGWRIAFLRADSNRPVWSSDNNITAFSVRCLKN